MARSKQLRRRHADSRDAVASGSLSSRGLPSRWWKLAIVSVGLALGAVAIYAPTVVVPHDFVAYDDPMYVLDQPVIRSGLSVEGIRWAATTVVAGNWHPMTVLSHMLDCELYGVAPRGHHLTSLLLHAANGVLLFLLFERMTAALWPSALVAALFAWHPLRVESVAWIAERKDVLSSFFLLLAMAAYVRYARRGGWIAYAACGVCLALGLLGKPMLVTAPFLLLLLDVWPLARIKNLASKRAARPRAIWQLLLEKLPFFALAAAAIGTTLWAQAEHGAIYDVPPAIRAANAVRSYYTYLAGTVFPYPLYLPYLLAERVTPFAWAWAGAVGLVLATALAVTAFRRRPHLTVGWLWYLGALVPVIGVVQVGEQAMADRYTYVPLIGIYVIVAWSLAELAELGRAWRWGVTAVAAASLVALIAASCVQVTYWRNTRTLFAHTLRYSPESHAARVALSAQAIYDEDYATALDEARRAKQINPASRDAAATIAMALARTGQTGAAIDAYQEAIVLNPQRPMLVVELARILASCDDQRYRSGPDAVQMLLLAERGRIRAQDPLVLDTLAAAQAETGNWNEAVATASLALDNTRRLINAGHRELEPLARGLEMRLALYRRQLPYRVPHGVWEY